LILGAASGKGIALQGIALQSMRRCAIALAYAKSKSNTSHKTREKWGSHFLWWQQRRTDASLLASLGRRNDHVRHQEHGEHRDSARTLHTVCGSYVRDT